MISLCHFDPCSRFFPGGPRCQSVNQSGLGGENFVGCPATRTHKRETDAYTHMSRLWGWRRPPPPSSSAPWLQVLLPLAVVVVSCCCCLGADADGGPPHPSDGLAADFTAMLEEWDRNTGGGGGDLRLLQDDDPAALGRLLQDDELAFCYDALYLADADKNSQVDAKEFVTFVQIMGPPGFLPEADEFADLPLILQSNFIILACLCLQQPSARPTCCTEAPYIDNTGTSPGQVPTADQQQYLFQVCFLTETSIERVLASQEPSAAPGGGAVPTPAPAPAPTAPPAPAPTAVPVSPPTPPPAPAPTAAPVSPPPTPPPVEETRKPTAVPTPKPTAAVATPEPTLATTPKPTAAEATPEPTAATARPTVPPTAAVAPSQEPAQDTPQPTAPDSESPTVGPEPASPEPTADETAVPTGGPSTPDPTTARPTAAPTKTPTASETDKPTTAAAPTPTAAPSVASSEPTAGSPVVSDQVVPTTYEIAVRGGATGGGEDGEIPPSLYTPDLVAAMNLLAQEVAEAWTDGGPTSSPTAVPASRRTLRAADPHGGDRRQHDRRRLAATTTIKVNFPTEVDGIASSTCPGFVDQSSNRCEDVTASVPLIVVVSGGGTEDDEAAAAAAAAAADSYAQDLNTAIEEGGLQDALKRVNPDSPVVVLTGLAELPTEPPSEGVTSGGGGRGLSSAGIAGIVVGVVAVLAGSYLAVGQKKRRRDAGQAGGGGDDDAGDLKDIEGAEMDAAVGDGGDLKGDDPGHGEGGSGVPEATALAAAGGAAAAMALALAPPKADEKGGSPSRKKKSSSSGALYHVPGAKGVSDEGSSAGESGWSSNQDQSSVDSKSLDGGPSPGPAPVGGAEALAGAGAEASDAQTDYSNRSLEGQTNEPDQDNSQTDTDAGLTLQSTYSELDQAIQKGDWAAVGVTAALLASQAYSTEDDSTAGSSKPKVQQKASLNPQRAAELDALVEAGDWEGVVAAAAKFDAQEALRGGSDSQVGSGSQHSRSIDSTSGGASVGGSSTGTGPSFLSATGTIESTTSPSVGTIAGMTATSDTASTRSKSRKLNEIRDEVETLVNAVVPEEADNVDEMMTQFRGREEELVETLRSMQERQVAQKARLESQKQAKRDAKAYVETKQGQPETRGAIDNTGSPADEEWMEDIDNAGAPAQGELAAAGAGAGAILGIVGGTMEPPREEDEQQEAMAMQEQLKIAIEREDWENVAEAASGLSGHTVDINDDSRGDSDSPSNASVRSQEINSLVDKGDWDGVVAAASRYVESDTQKVNPNTTAEDTDSSIEDRRRRRQERLKEEEEALAQAEIWNAIAEQTRAESKLEEESANVAGANLAAAWAIDRSLSALRKAEEDEQDRDSDKKKDDDDDADREV